MKVVHKATFSCAHVHAQHPTGVLLIDLSLRGCLPAITPQACLVGINVPAW